MAQLDSLLFGGPHFGDSIPPLTGEAFFFQASFQLALEAAGSISLPSAAVALGGRQQAQFITVCLSLKLPCQHPQAQETGAPH